MPGFLLPPQSRLGWQYLRHRAASTVTITNHLLWSKPLMGGGVGVGGAGGGRGRTMFRECKLRIMVPVEVYRTKGHYCVIVTNVRLSDYLPI